MIDLAREEERVAFRTGITFERLLERLDELEPAGLVEAYEHTVDRYLVLAGKGKRTGQEQLELDRLDDGLRFLLGPRGVFMSAGWLLQIADRIERAAGLFAACARGGKPEVAGELGWCLLQARSAAREVESAGVRLEVGKLLGHIERMSKLASVIGARCRKGFFRMLGLTSNRQQMPVVQGLWALGLAPEHVACLRRLFVQRASGSRRGEAFDAVVAYCGWLACQESLVLAEQLLRSCAELAISGLSAGSS